MSAINLAILNRILSQEVEMRFQDPKIEKHGTKKLFWRIRPHVPVVVDGRLVRKQVSIRLGFCDSMTLSDAKKAKQEYMATVNAGRVVVQAQLPFSAVLDKFESGKVPLLSKTTQAKYRFHICNHIRPAFGHLRVMEIDRASVQIWMTAKKEAGLSWATLSDLRALLSTIFNQAREWKLWDGDNPAEKIDVGRKRDAREKKLLSEADFQRFLFALPDTRIMRAEKVRLMVVTALVGGLRVSEVLGLKREDVDPARGVVTIRRRWAHGEADIPKTTESAAEIDVSVGVAQKLAAIAESDWIFCREGETFPPDQRDLQQHVFRPTAKALGIYFEGFGMHTFRRMKITWTQKVGASAIEAMLLARHSDVKSTMRYTIMEPGRRKELTEAIAKKVVM